MGKSFTAILKDAYRFPKPEETVIKAVVRDWLETVDIPDYGSPEAIRRIMITLVDEPE